jgi:hypothetical protein
MNIKMKIKQNIFILISLAGFSSMALSEAVTGKIIIDGQEYSSGSSNVIQGSGKIVTDERKLNTFNELSINIAADIEYIASDSHRLELTADDNIAPTITSSIIGNTLSIDTNQSFSTQSKIRTKIYGPSTLQSVVIDGSSDVKLQGITGDLLEIKLDGSGDITAQGNVSKLIIKADGSGNINTKELLADDVIINIEGSTDVTVTANKNLGVEINGVSDVTYYGHPGSINKTIDGVGNVTAGD